MTEPTQRSRTAEDFLELGRGYQAAAVFTAAAELDLFSAFVTSGALSKTLGTGAPVQPSSSGPPASRTLTAVEVARERDCDLRGLTVLLDALVALKLLDKAGPRYSLPDGFAGFLTPTGKTSILAMAQHQATCLRNWAQLARAVKEGRPAERLPTVRGDAGAQEAFIGAMHNVSAPNADRVIRGVQPLEFRRLLDVGGASGTWTIAFLRACPTAAATLFDLPPVIPLARRRLEAEGLLDRVRLVPGDFTQDPLPPGADLVWLSAIIHQNSRAQNRALFRQIHRALVPGGRLAIRDILMDETRTDPVAGALFAVNMLVATEGGGTFTFDELRADLEAAGFVEAAVSWRDPGMNSIVQARKPRV